MAILYEEQNCPYCDMLIEDGDTVYLRDDEIIGCENCIDCERVHITTEEEIEEEYRENLYEDEKITKMFDL